MARPIKKSLVARLCHSIVGTKCPTPCIQKLLYSNCIIHNKAQVALEDMLYCDTNNLSQGININIINTVQCL